MTDSLIRLSGFGVMVSAYSWFATADTLEEMTGPCLLAAGGTLMYCAASFWKTNKGIS